jgi:hypothetical protein
MVDGHFEMDCELMRWITNDKVPTLPRQTVIGSSAGGERAGTRGALRRAGETTE